VFEIKTYQGIQKFQFICEFESEQTRKNRRGDSDDLMTVQLVPLGEERLTGKFSFLTNDVVGWTFLHRDEDMVYFREANSWDRKKNSLKDLDYRKVRISQLDNDDEDSDSDESPSKGEDKLPDQICVGVELRIPDHTEN